MEDTYTSFQISDSNWTNYGIFLIFSLDISCQSSESSHSLDYNRILLYIRHKNKGNISILLERYQGRVHYLSEYLLIQITYSILLDFVDVVSLQSC